MKCSSHTGSRFESARVGRCWSCAALARRMRRRRRPVPPPAGFRAPSSTPTPGRRSPNAIVAVRDANVSTVTDAAGAFTLIGLAAEPQTLFVSLVGFGLARPTVDVPSSGAATITIPLASGTGAYTESVTVRADPFRRATPGTPSEQTLTSADITALRGVLTDDPCARCRRCPASQQATTSAATSPYAAATRATWVFRSTASRPAGRCTRYATTRAAVRSPSSTATSSTPSRSMRAHFRRTGRAAPAHGSTSPFDPDRATPLKCTGRSAPRAPPSLRKVRSDRRSVDRG